MAGHKKTKTSPTERKSARISRRTMSIVAIVAALALATLIIIIYAMGSSRQTFEGKITCLPHKGPGPHTLECAFGFREDSGKYYSLRSATGAPLDLYRFGSAEGVKIIGEFKEASSDVYRIDGRIDVYSIEAKTTD